MRNQLNRNKNHSSDFSDIYFSSYRHFLVILVLELPQFSINFHDNSKNKNKKNPKIDVLFVSAHSASSMKTGSKLRECLHILSWECPN